MMSSYDYSAGNDKHSSVDDVYDLKYKIFLENVKKDGKSYVLRIVQQNRLPCLLKYEDKDDSLDEWGTQKCDISDGSGSKRKENRKNSSKITKKKQEAVDSRVVAGKNKEAAVEDVRNLSRIQKKVLEDVRNLRTITKKRKEVQDVRDSRTVTKKKKENIHHVRNSRKVDKEDREEVIKDVKNMVDEDYLFFIAGHRQTGKGSIKFFYEGRWVVYEEDSESEVSEIDPRTLGKEESNPFETEKEDNNQYLGGLYRSSQSQFRKKLLVVLQRPYDRVEFKKLRDEISARKPIKLHRELRDGRDIMCSSDRNGKSYLDHYSHFRRKFEAAKGDRSKELNLLRGFFFYIENITHVGAFSPWSDPSCLSVMPESR